jgi:hypothetical protein
MNFGIFQDFSTAEAHDWLSRFLTEEGGAMEDYAANLEGAGVEVDYSLRSVPSHVSWVANSVRTLKLPPDPEIPSSIRLGEAFRDENFEFDGPSRVLLMRLSYYLGETFVREFPALSWAVGAADTALQGQPVVTGFSHQIEMPVLMVSENWVRDFLAGGVTSSSEGDVIPAWINLLSGA